MPSRCMLRRLLMPLPEDAAWLPSLSMCICNASQGPAGIITPLLQLYGFGGVSCQQHATGIRVEPPLRELGSLCL